MRCVNDFLIANVAIRLQTNHPIQITDAFHPFLRESLDADVTVSYSQEERISKPKENVLFTNYAFSVIPQGNSFRRYYHKNNDPNDFYAVSKFDASNDTVEVCYLSKDANLFDDSHKCFLHAGFEEILFSRNRIILHASAIRSPYGGILFSGPSGIGKSTQAELWRKYENSMVINGDRPILARGKNGWLAYGSPYAGSSNYHIDDNVPIKAIVLLEQAPSCSIRQMSASEAFRHLYAGAVVNSWNMSFASKMCDLMMDVVMSVPVYALACTPDHEAVDTLKNVMESKGTD